MAKNNIAIATLLYSPDYLPGVFTLVTQLKKLLSNSQLSNIKLCLFVTTDLYHGALTELSRNLLTNLFSDVIEIQPLSENDEIIKNNQENLELLKRPELAYALIKARLWEQIQYSQIIYLDADTLPTNSSFFDIFGLTENQTNLQVAASPDIGWPDMFNSGVMSIIPDIKIARELEQFILREKSIDGADQGILNQFFNEKCRTNDGSDINRNKEWIVLPFLYNVTTPNTGYQFTPAMNFFKPQIKLIHFIGKNKPWKLWSNDNFISNEYTNEWHSIYDEFCDNNGVSEGYKQKTDHEHKQQHQENAPEQSHDIKYEENDNDKQSHEVHKEQYPAENSNNNDDQNDNEYTTEQQHGLSPYVQPEALSQMEENQKNENVPNVEQQPVEKPVTPVFIPLDFKEWLTTFIEKEDFGANKQKEQQQQQPSYEVKPEEDIEELQLDSTQEERIVGDTEQVEKEKEIVTAQEEKVERVVQTEPEPEPEVPLTNFRFDWEDSSYLRKVERIFPGDIFEYESKVDEESEEEDDNDNDVEDVDVDACMSADADNGETDPHDNIDFGLRDYIDIGPEEDDDEGNEESELHARLLDVEENAEVEREDENELEAQDKNDNITGLKEEVGLAELEEEEAKEMQDMRNRIISPSKNIKR